MNLDLLQKNWPNILFLCERVLVRNFVASALATNGYSVLRAADPEEALQLLATPSRPVRVLLICSVQAPDLELIERCTSARPDLKAIILSSEMQAALAELAKFDACSTSPALPDILLQTIHRAISDRAFAHQIGKL